METSRGFVIGDVAHEAAFQGSSEIGFTIFSISLSLLRSFPILLMAGMLAGCPQFAITLSTAILSRWSFPDHYSDDVRVFAQE